jgi:hypothetical protein
MPTKSALISGLAAAAVIGGLAYWVLSGDETQVPEPHADVQIKAPTPLRPTGSGRISTPSHYPRPVTIRT